MLLLTLPRMRQGSLRAVQPFATHSGTNYRTIVHRHFAAIIFVPFRMHLWIWWTRKALNYLFGIEHPTQKERAAVQCLSPGPLLG